MLVSRGRRGIWISSLLRRSAHLLLLHLNLLPTPLLLNHLLLLHQLVLLHLLQLLVLQLLLHLHQHLLRGLLPPLQLLLLLLLLLQLLLLLKEKLLRGHYLLLLLSAAVTLRLHDSQHQQLLLLLLDSVLHVQLLPLYFLKLFEVVTFSQLLLIEHVHVHITHSHLGRCGRLLLLRLRPCLLSGCLGRL